MKKVFTIMCLVVVATFIGSRAKAQDVSSLEGSNYYLIYLDADTESNYDITSKIVQDLRPNWDATSNPTGEKALYIWSNTYVNNAATGKGSFGQIGGFLDFSVGTVGWSGLGFCMRDNLTGTAPKTFPIDYTAITDDYHFHMAVRSSYAAGHAIQVAGSSTGVIGKLTVNAAQFNVGVGKQDATLPNITPNFVSDGTTWNVIDMTVKDLRTYGWTNRSTILPSANYFVTLSGAGPNEIAVDAVFFYKPASSGINDLKANKLNVLVTNRVIEVQNANAPIEVYSITGALVKKSLEPVFGVDGLVKGAYVIKSGNAVAKVMIK
ncbi:MAG: hypothetical protein Q8904_03765 [Bacteroidota bacterium]|nr:hypothetical protein [Bacteroidota bacterium]